MTTIETAPGTSHAGLQSWVDEVAALTQPDEVVWCDGSPEEWDRLTTQLVEGGTFTRLNPEKKPNSFHCASDPSDVARVEDRTYICSLREEDAGFTNNWMDPTRMKATMTDLYRGSMVGRTMYVIPFVMGHLEADVPMYGVEVTDSAYVVVSMHIMARVGTAVLRAMEEQDAPFVKALHSVGFPLPEGKTFLIAEEDRIGRQHPFSTEKLGIVMAIFRYQGFDDALDKVRQIFETGGRGQHVQGRDGERRRVGEAGEGVVRVGHPGHQEGHRPAQDGERRRDALGDEHPEDDDDDDQRDDGVGGQRRGIMPAPGPGRAAAGGVHWSLGAGDGRPITFGRKSSSLGGVGTC